MASAWAPKAPTEVVERRWTVPVDSDDGLASFVVVASGVTKDSQSIEGDDAIVVLSAGTAGSTHSVTFTATTSQGRTLVETFYIPVRASTALGDTAQDIVTFAYRRAKVIPQDEEPEAHEQERGLEELTAMLSAWAASGADIGHPLPIDNASVFSIPNEYLQAVRYNLTLAIADRFGSEITPLTAQMAMRGLQLVKQAQVPDKREAVFY